MRRVLVVGTTPDYVRLIEQRRPGRALFLTQAELRAEAREPAPAGGAEALCDLSDHEAAWAALQGLLAWHGCMVSGVACYDCESLRLAAVIADRLGLPFPSREAVAAARDKAEMKRLWREAGLVCPRAQVVRSSEEAAAASHAFGAPVVLKPLSGSGSELVFLCESLDEVENAAAALLARLANHPDARLYADHGARASLVVEEYIQGVELSCDFVVDGATARIVRIAEKIPRPGDFGTTLAYVVPGRLPDGLPCDALVDVLTCAAHALGLDRALCMVDLIVRNGRLYLIELSPRPGGDCLPDVLAASACFDVISAELDFAEGVVMAVPPIEAWRPTVGLRIFADQAGILRGVDFSAIVDDSRVVGAHLKHPPGHEITLPPADYDSRILGHIVFHPSGDRSIVEQCRELLAGVRVHVGEPPYAAELDGGQLAAFVSRVLSKRERYLEAARSWGSPLYLLERDVLLERARAFRSAFEAELPHPGFFYALKSNNCPQLARILVGAGWGLDVSGGAELTTALMCGASQIVFSGPGKTDSELAKAVRRRDRVTVLIDSHSELERLARIASGMDVRVRAGVRLRVSQRGLWRKFGVPLGEITGFMERAEGLGAVDVCGLQFHCSWNMTPDTQVSVIEQVGAMLAEMPDLLLERIEFLDIGGGFWPPEGEWLHAAAAGLGDYDPGPTPHQCVPATPIEQFAKRIGDAVRTHIVPHSQCRVCLEPGRWICHDAMQILLTVVDKKAEDLVITDAGTNAVGWERYETDYFPVVNLTHPGIEERACFVLGSLCTPHDVWGYTYHGAGIEPGDVLLVPSQGAYTYSLRQHFIKPLPRLVVL